MTYQAHHDATTTELHRRMLSGVPFTMRELSRGGDHDVVVGRMVHRLRKAGLLTFRFEGGRVIWSAVYPTGERSVGELTD